MNYSSTGRDKLGRYIKGHESVHKGTQLSDSAKKKISLGNTGKKRTPEFIEKMKQRLMDNGNGRWKGDKVGYRSLHYWVESHLGRPETCEHCGKSGLSGRQIHWANKSRKYKRVITDWIRLCVACHKIYDKKKGV